MWITNIGWYQTSFCSPKKKEFWKLYLDDRINDQMPHDHFHMDTFFSETNTVEDFVKNMLAEITAFNTADAPVRIQGLLWVSL